MIGIYGANGFIGRHLVRRLAKNGDLRAVSSKFTPDFTDSLRHQVAFIEADFNQPSIITPTLKGVSTVIQLVSNASPALQNNQKVTDIVENVIPHVQFLNACVQAGVKRYVFLSSGGTIYGPDAPTPTSEACQTNPISSYGLTKLTIEKYIQMHGHVDGLEYIILRVSNPFGPEQKYNKGQGLIAAILGHWQRNLPIKIMGEGTALRDYIYIDDLIDAIEAAVYLSGMPKCILNIGSGEVKSVLEVIDTIEAATGHQFVRQYAEARKTDIDVVSLDICRAKKMLNWTPKTQFSRGIALTVEHNAPDLRPDT